jgi:hypothetical protein
MLCEERTRVKSEPAAANGIDCAVAVFWRGGKVPRRDLAHRLADRGAIRSGTLARKAAYHRQRDRE